MSSFCIFNFCLLDLLIAVIDEFNELLEVEWSELLEVDENTFPCCYQLRYLQLPYHHLIESLRTIRCFVLAQGVLVIAECISLIFKISSNLQTQLVG